MRHIFFAMLCGLLFGLPAFGQTAGEPQKVGVILGLTGLGNSYNIDLRDGMEFCRKSPQPEMIFEDSQNIPTTALTAFTKLATQDRIDLAVVSFSPIARAIIPAAKARRVPLLMTLVSASRLGKDAGPLAFRFFSSGRQEGPILAELAVQKLRMRRAAILYLDDDYGQEYTEHFSRRFAELDGEITAALAFAKSELDLRSFLLRIKSKAPQLLLTVGLNEHLEVVSRQMREIGLDAAFLTNWSGLTPATADKIIKETGKFYTAAPACYLPGNQAVSPFIKSIEAKLQRKISAYAALGCDVRSLLEAAAASGDIVNYLRTVKDFPGVMGKLKTNENGEIEFPLFPVIVRKEGAAEL